MKYIKLNKTITFGCTYNESQEILACVNIDRELESIQGSNTMNTLREVTVFGQMLWGA